MTSNVPVNPLFLSTPVLMHSGLVCIALSVCLSVTGPKFRLDNKSLDLNSHSPLPVSHLSPIYHTSALIVLSHNDSGVHALIVEGPFYFIMLS